MTVKPTQLVINADHTVPAPGGGKYYAVFADRYPFADQFPYYQTEATMTSLPHDPPSFRATDPLPLPDKNPITSTGWWGNVVAIVGFVFAWLVRTNKLPAAIEGPVKSMSLDFIAAGLGVALAFYGRWRADRALSFSAPVKDPPHVARMVQQARIRKANLNALVPFGLAILCLTQGCTSQGAPPPLQQVQTARQSYVAALAVITPLTRSTANPSAPWDPSMTQRKLFVEIRKEARAALDDAEETAASGKPIASFNFAMRRALSAVSRLLAYQYQAKTAARAKGVAIPDPPSVPVTPTSVPQTSTPARGNPNPVRRLPWLEQWRPLPRSTSASRSSNWQSLRSAA